MDDDLKDVQPYPVELWPESRPVVGRSSSGEQLYPYQVAVVLGRGKLPNIEVALTKWEEYQVKLLGSGFGMKALVAASTSARPGSFPASPSLRRRIGCCSGSKRCWRARDR